METLHTNMFKGSLLKLLCFTKNLKCREQASNKEKKEAVTYYQVVSGWCFLDVNELTGAKNESDVPVSSYRTMELPIKLLFKFFAIIIAKDPQKPFALICFLHHRQNWHHHAVISHSGRHYEKDRTTIHKLDLQKVFRVNNR